jgi:hypothetical protein
MLGAARWLHAPQQTLMRKSPDASECQVSQNSILDEVSEVKGINHTHTPSSNFSFFNTTKVLRVARVGQVQVEASLT